MKNCLIEHIGDAQGQGYIISGIKKVINCTFKNISCCIKETREILNCSFSQCTSIIGGFKGGIAYGSSTIGLEGSISVAIKVLSTVFNKCSSIFMDTTIPEKYTGGDSDVPEDLKIIKIGYGILDISDCQFVDCKNTLFRIEGRNLNIQNCCFLNIMFEEHILYRTNSFFHICVKKENFVKMQIKNCIFNGVKMIDDSTLVCCYHLIRQSQDKLVQLINCNFSNCYKEGENTKIITTRGRSITGLLDNKWETHDAIEIIDCSGYSDNKTKWEPSTDFIIKTVTDKGEPIGIDDEDLDAGFPSLSFDRIRLYSMPD